jgi:hypothetical protein
MTNNFLSKKLKIFVFIFHKFYIKMSHRILSTIVISAAIISGISLMFTPYMGDETWALYLFGTQYINDPKLLFARPVYEIPVWLGFGNFRPLGRFFEHLGYVGPIFFSRLVDITPEDLYAIQRLILHLCFLFTAYSFTKHFAAKSGIRDRHPALLFSTILIAITLINSASGGLRLFPSFYTTAYIIIILSLVLVLRFEGADTPRRRKATFFVIGVVAATYNELTNLIIPLAFLLVFILNNSSKFTFRVYQSLKFLSPMLLSFFAILIPIRVEIWRICSTTDCYSPSNLSFDSTILPTILNRLTSAVPPVPQMQTKQWTSGVTTGTITILATICLGFLVALASAMIFKIILSTSYSLSFPIHLISFGLGTSVVTASVLSLSSDLQSLDSFGVSWRETPLYLFGFSLTFLGLIFYVLQKMNLGSKVKGIAVGILCVVLGFSAYTNTSYNFKITRLYQSQENSSATRQIEKFVIQNSSDNIQRSEICTILTNRELFGENASAALIQGINNYSLLRNNKALCNLQEVTP